MNKEEIEKSKEEYYEYIQFKLNATEIAEMDNIFDYIEELENKVKELIKGQASLMQSRKKWRAKYYKERRKRKEADKSVEQIYEDYQDIGKMFFELDEKVDKVIDKLKEDTDNYQKKYKELHHELQRYECGKYQGKIHLAQEILDMLGGKDGKDRRMEKYS